MRWLTPLIAGAAVGITMRLLYSGTPDGPYHAMMRSFVFLVPVLVGAVAVYVAERDRRRSVRWLYHFSADSFPPHALDDHVRIGGRYFDLIDTEYSLRTVSEGTELRVRMTYRVSTAFNWYARPLASFFVGNFEEAALAFYAHRAERINASH
jgi:hypothetical protein